jgi:alkaline phosphatase
VNLRRSRRQALGLLMCAFAVCVAEAAPKVLRLTPPSYLFSGAERAGAEGIMLARFLPGQYLDLQATLVPDAGQTIGTVQFLIDGKSVPGGKAETATTGLWKELPPGTLVASLRGIEAPAKPGDYLLEVEAVQSDGQRVRAAGEFRVQALTGAGRKVRKVIFMLGDGMGNAQRTGARLMLRGVDQGKSRGKLAMDMPYTAFVTTSSLDGIVTDSAPGMSSYFSGNKHRNETVGVFPDDTNDAFDNPRIEYLTAYLHRKLGFRLGVVTTADVSDATPAGSSIHTEKRRNGTGIVDQFLDERSRTGLALLMGGGRRWFLPATTPGSSRTRERDMQLSPEHAAAWGVEEGAYDPERDLIADFTRAGFHYVSNATELAALPADTQQVLGLFAYSNMNVALDKIAGRRGTSTVVADYGLPNQPMLDEMTRSALAVMERSAPKGFVLLVEGASIDKQAHAMDSERWLLEAIEFDRAIAVARAYAAQHADTLVVVTADHETAGVSLIGGSRLSAAELAKRAAKGGGEAFLRDGVVGTYEQARFPQYRIAPDGFPETTEIDGKLLVGYGANADRYEDWVTNARPLNEGGAPTPGAVPNFGLPAGQDRPDLRDSQGGLFFLGQVPDSVATHTAADVPLTADGLGGNLFHGVLDNTDIFFTIAGATLLGVDWAPPAPAPAATVGQPKPKVPAKAKR